MTSHPAREQAGDEPQLPSLDDDGTNLPRGCLVLGCLGLAVGGFVLIAVILLPLVAALMSVG